MKLFYAVEQHPFKRVRINREVNKGMFRFREKIVLFTGHINHFGA